MIIFALILSILAMLGSTTTFFIACAGVAEAQKSQRAISCLVVELSQVMKDGKLLVDADTKIVIEKAIKEKLDEFLKGNMQ